MCRVLRLFFAALAFVQVHGLNEILRGTQPLYGIATLSAEVANETCFKELGVLQMAVDEDKVWAVKAMDASGRPEFGFIYGNNLWIGSHSQCQDISNTEELQVNHNKILRTKTNYDHPPYAMRFTMVYLKHNSTLQYHTRMPLEWTIQLGLCVPASCKKEDILALAEVYFSGDFLELKRIYHLDLEVIDAKPLVEDYLWILALPKTIVLCVIWIVIIVLTVIGTTYDVRRHNLEKNLVAAHNGIAHGKSLNSITVSTIELVSKSSSEDISEPSTLAKIVKCFSVYSNAKKLLKIKLTDDSIPCIHGLRFLTMLWVIAGHSIYFQADYLTNVPTTFRLSETIIAQVISNPTFCIDTYLFLSGFLVTYLYYKSHNPHEKSDLSEINYAAKVKQFLMMFVNRFFRLTPLYMVVLLFSDVSYTFYEKTSSLTSYERPDLLCEKYWWRNLLYINNFFPRSELCLSWSWYVSIDLQLFTLTSLLLVMSTIMFKLSAVVTVLLILVNIAVAAYNAFFIGYIPTLDEQLAQLDIFYYRPWMRMGPYMIGAITGYILIIKLKNKLTLKQGTKIGLWVVFSAVNLWILLALYDRDVSLEFSAFYTGISRPLWAIGLAWILISCHTGNARIVDKFLSFKQLILLSRLTYSAFLLNPVVINIFFLGAESSLYSSTAGFAVQVCGMMVLSFVFSFIFSVLVESPFLLLTKMVFSKVTKRKPSPPPAPQQFKTIDNIS